MDSQKETGIKHSLKADLWLVGMCVIWGASFPLVKIALRDIDPMPFLGLRFWAGWLCLLPFVWRRKKSFSRSMFIRGSVLALFLFLGMLFQTLGLKYTTASNSAFITGMAVVIVPVLVVIIERKRPGLPILTGIMMAVGGLYFLTLPYTRGFNKGDVLTLFCALSFSFEIVFIEMLVKDGEAIFIATIMIFVTAVLATFVSLISGNQHIQFTFPMFTGLGYVSVFCTAIGFVIQTHWQPKTSAMAASVIYTLEPVFAVIFAAVLLFERLAVSGLIGGGMIITGMFIAELRR